MWAPETQITSNKLFQLWHIDPKGDSGPPCHDPGDWRWHIRHWEFKPPSWYYSMKWRWFRKCYICGKRGRKRNWVNLNDHKGYRHLQDCPTEEQR